MQIYAEVPNALLGGIILGLIGARFVPLATNAKPAPSDAPSDAPSAAPSNQSSGNPT